MSANFRNPNFLLPNEVNMATNPALSEDRHSLYSMEFDGATKKINLGDSDIFSFGDGSTDSPLSFSVWINLATLSTPHCVINKQTSSSNGEYKIYISTAGKIYIELANNGGEANGARGIQSGTNLSIDQWYHLAFTYDGRGGSSAYDGMNLYINGSLDSSTDWSYLSYTAMNNTNADLILGDLITGGSNTYDFQGKMDEVAIFNTALTENEVQALSTANAPANIMALNKKPIAYYPLGEQARDNTEWQFPNQVLQSHVFDFSGSNQNINLGNDASLYPGTSDMSYSFWFKSDSFSGYKTIFLQGAANLNVLNQGDKAVFITTLGDELRVFVTSNTGGFGNDSNNAFDTSNANFVVNQWYHIVFTLDRDGDAVIYINGVPNITQLVKSSSSSVDIVDTDDSIIGGVAYDFDGKISNFQIFNTVLSLNNVETLYNNGSPYIGTQPQSNNLKAWYKLNATNTYAGLNPNFHSALSFDGSSDYIDFGNPTELQLTGALTFSGWIKTSSSSYQLMISKDDVTNRCFNFGLFNTGEVYGQVFNSGSATTVQTTTTWKDGDWHHIALVYIPSVSIEIFVDGNSEKLSTTSIPASIDNDPANFNIGRRTDGARYFNGSLSNVAIFNQNISSEDVLYLYNGGTPQTNISFEPTSWYKLDNLTTGIQDSGSASNNGTNNGATEVTDSVAVNQWNFNNVSQSQTPNYSSALNFIPNDRVDLPNISALDNATQFTISTWAYWDTTGNTNEWLFMAANSSRTIRVQLELENQKIYFRFMGATGDVRVNMINSAWVNVVAVFDTNAASADKMIIYLNGARAANVAYTEPTGNSPTGMTVASIGGRADGYGFDGKISNFAVFSTALSTSQVQTIYNSGTPQNTILGSPQGWWKLDSTTITDSSGNGNTGTNNGATEIQTNVWTPRLNGESDTLPSTALVSSDLQFESPYSNFSLDFDGAGNYINTSLDTDSYSSFSVSAWVNGDDVNTYRTVAAQTRYGNWANSSWLLYIEGGKMVFYIFSGGSIIQAGKDTAVSSGVWYNIVGTWDGSKSRLYINAVKENTEGTVSSMNTSTIPTLIGAYHDSAGTSIAGNWNGKLDECAIFNKALSQAEISQVYNNGYAADLTSLSPVSWWRLGEDAYFVGNDITIPNQISGAPNGTGAGTQTSILVANAPGSYASGVGTNLDVVDRKGEAPESSANSQSINMIPGDVHPYPPGYVPAQVNNIASMSFDGINDYFDAGNPIELQFTGAFSVSFWMKGNLASAGNRAMVSKDNNASNPRAFSIERTNAYPGGYFVVYNGTSAYGVYVASSDANYINIGDNNWHNVVGVYTPSASVALFVDGTFVKSNTTSIPSSVNFVNDNLNIGRRSQGVNYFPGDIDEVAVFNYALSPKQIKEDIYNASTTGKTADLNNNSNLTAPVAWYRMGD